MAVKWKEMGVCADRLCHFLCTMDFFSLLLVDVWWASVCVRACLYVWPSARESERACTRCVWCCAWANVCVYASQVFLSFSSHLYSMHSEAKWCTCMLLVRSFCVTDALVHIHIQSLSNTFRHYVWLGFAHLVVSVLFRFGASGANMPIDAAQNVPIRFRQWQFRSKKKRKYEVCCCFALLSVRWFLHSFFLCTIYHWKFNS